MNWHHCKFIRFGENSIAQVIGASEPNYYTTSLMHQLHKEDRSFVYYVKLLPWYKRPFCAILNNRRPFVLHMNMKKGAKNTD